MGLGEPRPRGRGRNKASAAMRALRGASDLYVRGLLDRLLEAGSTRRAGVARPTSSRVFGVGSQHSEEDLRDLVRAMQSRLAAAASVGSGNKEDVATASSAPPVKRRGATPLERIKEDAAVVHPTS